MPLKQYQKYIVTLAPIIFIGILCYFFFNIVTYIVLAWILSLIGAPLHAKLRKVVGNSMAAILTLISFLILALAILWLFIPPILQQARQFASIDYESMATSLEEPIEDWNEWLIDKGILAEADNGMVQEEENGLNQSDLFEVVRIDSLLDQYDSTRTNVTIVLQVNNQHTDSHNHDEEALQLEDSYLERARKNLLGFLNPSRISSIFNSIVGALGNILITLMSVMFIAFFFLREQGLFTSMIQSIVPTNQENQWTHAIDESTNLLKRYFIGILVQITLITIYITTILTILGFKNALLIGFFAALMNVIPYVGPLLGGVFGIVIVISSNIDASFYDVILPKMGIVALVFASMQLLDNLVIQPNVFSRSVKAHPLEIFIVILAGAQLGGVLGMVIAIPTYTILRVLAKVFLSEFKIVKNITREI